MRDDRGLSVDQDEEPRDLGRKIDRKGGEDGRGGLSGAKDKERPPPASKALSENAPDRDAKEKAHEHRGKRLRRALNDGSEDTRPDDLGAERERACRGREEGRDEREFGASLRSRR